MLDLSELEQWQESDRLEAKSARGGLPGLWDSVSAFANTDGGVIVLGVKENTKTHALHVVGVPDAHKMLEDFMNAAGSTDKLSLNVFDDRFTSQELEWTGNVFDFYDRVCMKLKQALDVLFKLDANMRRVDETPAHEALREAIVNAITNADFSSSRAVVVRWTEAGIELKNPGTFRVGVEGAYAGGTSDARNKNLLKMFSLIQIGERAGGGVPNMVDQWMSCGYGKPVLSEDYDPEVSTVLLPLSADSADGIPGKSAVNVGRKATGQTIENENAIVAYLAEHGESKSAEFWGSVAGRLGGDAALLTLPVRPRFPAKAAGALQSSFRGRRALPMRINYGLAISELEAIPMSDGVRGQRTIEALAARFPQLYVAPAEGTQEAHWLAAVRGIAPEGANLDHFVGDDEDALSAVDTPAGQVEALFLKNRADFETFIREGAACCSGTEARMRLAHRAEASARGQLLGVAARSHGDDPLGHDLLQQHGEARRASCPRVAHFTIRRSCR